MKTETRSEFNDKSKGATIRSNNIAAAKAVADAIRTSLGPRGMDKMIKEGSGAVSVTNDGATILKRMKLNHPAAKMMVQLSQSQDIEAGDGTTSVVVIAGSLLNAVSKLLDKGLHPVKISESFQQSAAFACELLEKKSVPVDLNNRDVLLKVASTTLNSKIVSQYSHTLSQIAVDSVMKISDLANNCADLRDIKMIKKLGGTGEDTELVDGLIIDRHVESLCNVKRVEKAKIALIEFCVSPPKTNMDFNVVVSEYSQMDRVISEERKYILNIVKTIKTVGCNVLLIQKSILRDAINDMALHFFSKMGIMVIKDIERNDVEFYCKSLNCKPIASLDNFTADKMAKADFVEEIVAGSSRVVKVTGITNPGPTVSILLYASNQMQLDETERSLHDAHCAIRCLVKKPALVAGGGAREIDISHSLYNFANTIGGSEQYCMRAYAEAMEVIPYTLAENAGLNPIQTVTELRSRHVNGQSNAGINIKHGCTSDILSDDVMQPLLVNYSALTLATETVCALLKIDDVVSCIR